MPENFSPLRYPGGKSKIAPFIRYIINYKINEEIDTYIEPFAGGAGVALDLLFSGTVNDIIINDYDKAIYSFWKAIILEPNRFIQKIINTDVTIDEWIKQKEIYLNQKNKYTFELGFATFFLNRTNRSGILTAGPIGGSNQNGNYQINARYNKEVLIQRIENIVRFKNHIKVYNKDIRSFIKLVVADKQRSSFVYFDPPYFVKGKELYINYLKHSDHSEIHNLIKNDIVCPWIMTYDDEASIVEIYSDYLIKKYDLIYSLANKGKSSELLIFSDANHCPTNAELEEANLKTRLI